jgi:Spx/MgsR family transcriptional regulator
MAWLDETGITYTFTDYREHPVPKDTLVQWAEQLGGWEKLVNRASLTWRNLAPDQKSASTTEEFLALIAQYPTLIRRPVIEGLSQGVAVGFSEKKYTALFGD